MHITLEADYAVRIVYSLAVEKKRMDAKSIAEKSGVTLRFSLKILRKLVASGIVQSYKGTQGGYEIAKPLEDITLYDVISTIEGALAISRCLEDGGFVCTREKQRPCQFQKVFGEITGIVVDKLKAVTFAQMADGERRSGMGHT